MSDTTSARPVARRAEAGIAGGAPASPAGSPIRFSYPLDSLKFEDSGAGGGQYTITATAAVFNVLSHDAGGFRFRLRTAAFTDALNANPDAHLVIGHDMDKVLARTKSGTLKLRQTAVGLETWARVAPTSYAADLRILLERGDVDQMSWAGYIGADEWSVADDGTVICDVVSISELVDVTVCAQGMFPQTRARLEASRHFQQAVAAGRVPQGAGAAVSGVTEAARPEGAGVVTHADRAGDASVRAERLAQVREAKAASRAALLKECK